MIRLRKMVEHPIARILSVFVVSRVVVLAVLVGARTTQLELPGGDSVVDLLCRFDCSWYLGIVDEGYSVESPPGVRPDSTRYAFFPLYPLVVQLVSASSPLSALSAGILVSNVSFAAALVYVYYYARDLGFAHRVGMIAISVIAFGPASFVFSAVYTESLFLVLLAAAVFHLRRGEYGRAAIAAALLSATRPTGIAFAAFALAWLVRRHGRSTLHAVWSKPAEALPLVAAPLGLFAFWAFSFVETGDALAHVSANLHGWGWGSTNALEMLALVTRLDVSDKVLMAISGLTLGVALLLLRYRLFEEFVLVLASLAIIWTGGLAPWSMPRFALVLFPLAVAVGVTLRARPGAAAVLLAALATINGFMLIVGWALEAFVI